MWILILNSRSGYNFLIRSSHEQHDVTTVWALWYYRDNKIRKGQGHSTRSDQWTPPIENYVKINFNTCFLSIQRESFSGAIVCDANGCLLAVSTHPHSFVLDQAMEKARSCEQVVYLARDLGFRRAIFEGEAFSVEGLTPTEFGSKKPRQVLKMLWMRTDGGLIHQLKVIHPLDLSENLVILTPTTPKFYTYISE
ncbi:hypothetical protein V6N13_001169 [Hibiscus sabdariffa]